MDQIHHRISEKIPDKVFEHRKEVKRLSLLHKLAHKKVMLNDTIGRNSALKVNIDIMRKEIIFAQDSINDMKVEIEALSQGARAAHKISCVAGTIADETNNEILATKARREKNSIQVQAAAMALENQIAARVPRDENKDAETAEDKDPDNMKGKVFENPVVILDRMSERSKGRNEEKTKLTERFVRNAKIIEQSFETMSKNSGIRNIDEIVTNYLKAEEQQYQLATYINLLDGESD